MTIKCAGMYVDRLQGLRAEWTQRCIALICSNLEDGDGVEVEILLNTRGIGASIADAQELRRTSGCVGDWIAAGPTQHGHTAVHTRTGVAFRDCLKTGACMLC